MMKRTRRSKQSANRCKEHQDEVATQVTPSSAAEVGVDGGNENAAASPGTNAQQRGYDDERESLVNACERGPANRVTPRVEEVAAIHGFMTDLDCKILGPAVIGEAGVESPDVLYEDHVRKWLDRDPILTKAEVRSTGGGLHVILRLDEPIICGPGEAVMWDEVARGVRNALPGDPNLNGIIALTRPIGVTNSKYDPPREVRLLRPGELVTRDEVLDLNRRVTEQPARLWMRLFFGGERVSPCPFCGKESLGVAGHWQVRCYACGRMDAAALLYRFFAPEFLETRMEAQHG
jgi:hypothetical protein